MSRAAFQQYQQQAPRFSPDVLCGCGENAKICTTQKEGPNCGRDFLCCPNYPSKCSFFQWADQRQAPKKWAGAKRPAPEFRQHSNQYEKKQKAAAAPPNRLMPELEEQDCIPETPELSQLVPVYAPPPAPASSPVMTPWQEATMKLIAVQLEQNAKNTCAILDRLDKTVEALTALTEALQKKKEKRSGQSGMRIPPP